MLGICALAIEENESLFSLINRYCRITGISFNAYLGQRMASNYAVLRDFPIAFKTIVTRPEFRAYRSEKVISDHCASVYFGTTLLQPFRQQEINASLHRAGTLLQSSIGMSWGHLRFCPQCTRSEFESLRYSWWHRDHQLPLTNVCLAHQCALHSTKVNKLGTCLPHDLLGESVSEPQCEPSQVVFKLARFDQFLATGDRHAYLGALFGNIMADLSRERIDRFDVHLAAVSQIKTLLVILREGGLCEPFLDWERLNPALCRLLENGFDYSDPVVAVLLIIAMNGLLDF